MGNSLRTVSLDVQRLLTEGVQVSLDNGRVDVVRAGCGMTIKIVVRDVLQLRPIQTDEPLP